MTAVLPYFAASPWVDFSSSMSFVMSCELESQRYRLLQSIIELSRTQDEEVGDGTTSVIILGTASFPELAILNPAASDVHGTAVLLLHVELRDIHSQLYFRVDKQKAQHRGVGTVPSSALEWDAWCSRSTAGNPFIWSCAH
jgi:hypothetical protein